MPGATELAASGLLAVAVIGLVIWRRGQVVGASRPRAWLDDWLALEPAARLVVIGPVLALARRLAKIDDRVLDRGVVAPPGLVLTTARRVAGADNGLLDRAVDGSATLTRRAAEGTLSRAEAAVDGSVGAVARAAAALGRLARRPQTGQLHQYYAQAAAALAVVLVVVR